MNYCSDYYKGFVWVLVKKLLKGIALTKTLISNKLRVSEGIPYYLRYDLRKIWKRKYFS